MRYHRLYHASVVLHAPFIRKYGACQTLSFFCAHNLSKAGWSWGCVSAIDSNGRPIWIADAHRDDGKRFIVRADDLLTAFVELERQVLTGIARSLACSSLRLASVTTTVL